MGTSRRDPALDVIRGLCIVSMVIGHIAAGSPLYQATHGRLWVDGATGFVLLAGLVIGMVQRRTAPHPGLRILARRARTVWVAQVLLVVLALAAAPWRQLRPAATVPAAEAGGWVQALWQAATMRLNPIDVDILSMYVVLFGVAVIAVALLRARLLWLLALVSAWVYLLGLGDPSWASLPRFAGGPGSYFDIATWQLLFVSALVLGWYWHSDRVQRLLADRRAWWVAFGISVGGLLLHELVERHGALGLLPTVQAAFHTVFDGSALGIGRVLLGWAAFVVLYVLLRSRRAAAATEPVARLCQPIGRHSLGAYLILTTFDLVLPSVAPYETTSWVAVQWALVVITAAWMWASWRDSQERLSTRPSGSTTRTSTGVPRRRVATTPPPPIA